MGVGFCVLGLVVGVGCGYLVVLGGLCLDVCVDFVSDVGCGAVCFGEVCLVVFVLFGFVLYCLVGLVLYF